MRIAVAILSTLTLLGCSPEKVERQLGTSPNAPVASSTLALLWGMVVDESGLCIVGATATVVRGQAVGQSITQTTPCNAWAYDGGFDFSGLTPGVEMTLRLSALGYDAKEKTVTPSLGPQMAVVVELSRMN